MREFRQVIPEGMHARVEGNEVVYTPDKCPFEVGDIIYGHDSIFVFYRVSDSGNIIRRHHLYTIDWSFYLIDDNVFGLHYSEYTKATPVQESLFKEKCLENGVWFDKENNKWIDLKEGGVYSVTGKGVKKICIFENVADQWFNVYVLFDSASLDYCGNGVYLSYIENISEATEEEKKKLFDALKEKGKQWNEDNKCVEDLKWKPKEGEKYWHYSSAHGKLVQDTNDLCDVDYFRIKIGNCFKTKEECEKYAEYMRKCSMNYKK